jgi:polyhydroxyalkanoate synthesis regulator phasin
MVYEELQKLEKLTGQLVRRLKMLEKENEELHKELLESQQTIREKEDALENFKNQIKISKIVSNIPVENNASAELRGRIDNYIKEIDKIITHLSE